MKLKFFGPLGRVTGSCAMLWDDRLGVRLLVDCGARQGEGGELEWNEGPFPFEASEITHVLLTHAHIDHSGLLPRLVREGFRGEVICTQETADLAPILLRDAARYTNAFDESDVAKLVFDGRSECFNKPITITSGIWIHFYRTAHILGAVSVRVNWLRDGERRSIVFSGDLGPNEKKRESSLLMRHRMVPDPSDFAVVESTYGQAAARRRLSLEERLDALQSILTRAAKRGGPIIIPAFAADRFASVLLDISLLWGRDEVLRNLPVFCHSRMARELASVYAKHVGNMDITGRSQKVRPRWLSHTAFEALGLDADDVEDERRLIRSLRAILGDAADNGADVLPALRPVHTWVDRPLAHDGAHVVITTGGMCEGGPVIGYLQRHLSSSAATVLTTGYAAKHTVAAQLFELGTLGCDQRERLNGSIKVPSGANMSIRRSSIAAHIEALDGYSAHADQFGLLDWVSPTYKGEPRQTGKVVFIQHGPDQKREALAKAIRQREGEVRVECPKDSEELYDLDDMKATSSRTVLEHSRLLRACSRDVLETRILALEAQTRVLGDRLAAMGG